MRCFDVSAESLMSGGVMDEVAVSAASALRDADDRAWLAGAFIRLALAGAFVGTDVVVEEEEDRLAAEVLAASGVLVRRGDGFELPAELAAQAGSGLDARAQDMLASLRQLATVSASSRRTMLRVGACTTTRRCSAGRVGVGRHDAGHGVVLL
jgi:hypothetical protein